MFKQQSRIIKQCIVIDMICSCSLLKLIGYKLGDRPFLIRINLKCLCPKLNFYAIYPSLSLYWAASENLRRACFDLVTILYTDYILSNLIENLNQLKDFNSTMIYVSDHGESLGEKNLYMHGIPASIAPKEQLEIPFMVWHSENSKEMINNLVNALSACIIDCNVWIGFYIYKNKT